MYDILKYSFEKIIYEILPKMKVPQWAQEKSISLSRVEEINFDGKSDYNKSDVFGPKIFAPRAEMVPHDIGSLISCFVIINIDP